MLQETALRWTSGQFGPRSRLVAGSFGSTWTRLSICSMVSLPRRRRMREGTSKNGWTRVAFGDVVRQVKDHVDPEETELERYIAGEHMDSDDLRIRRWGLIGDGYLGPAFHMRFKPGHVLYGSRRTYLRKVAVAEFEGITANTTFVIEPKNPDVLLPDLLPFIMQTESFHEHSIKQSKGSVNPYVNFSDLTWYEFALPPPEEQRDIVNLLNPSAQLVDHCVQLENKYDVVIRSTIDSHVERIVPEAKRFAALGQPGNVRVVPLDEAAKVTDCKHRTPTIVEDGIPMVAPGDVEWGRLRLQGCKRIARSEYSEFMDHVVVSPGDLVLSRNQTYGKAAYVVDDSPFALGQDTVLLQNARYPTFFVYLMLRSTFVQRQIERFAMGTTFKRVNLGDIRRLGVPAGDPSEVESVTALSRELVDQALKLEQRRQGSIETHRKLLNA